MKPFLLSIGILAAAAAAGVGAAQAPQTLTDVVGGVWEVFGVPGAKTPTRQCIVDPVELAFAEHSAGGCKHQMLADTGTSMRISYTCAGSGFGQAVFKTITPRSLRIEVQGIADGAPYGYVMQAHRIGDCPEVGKGSGGKQERGH